MVRGLISKDIYCKELLFSLNIIVVLNNKNMYIFRHYERSWSHKSHFYSSYKWLHVFWVLTKSRMPLKPLLGREIISHLFLNNLDFQVSLLET